MVHPCRLTLINRSEWCPCVAFRVMLGGRHPGFAPGRLQDTQRIGSLSNPSITSTEVDCLLRYYGKRRHTRPAEPMQTAHKTAHQLAIRAFVDWRWMRGRTRPDMPRSNQATTSFAFTHFPASLLLALKARHEFRICIARTYILL